MAVARLFIFNIVLMASLMVERNLMYSKDDYFEAIYILFRGSSQLEPNGIHCSICEDIGHQAWQCHHNPLNHAKQFWASMTSFRCFHCGRLFTGDKDAIEHFGEKASSFVPLCRRSRMSLETVYQMRKEDLASGVLNSICNAGDYRMEFIDLDTIRFTKIE